jgi:hypothetical protein
MAKQPINTDFFQELENTRPFLKMAFEGFAGSGKTFTATRVAIGLHKAIKSKKPIVYYDTERALKALKQFFDGAGIKVLTRESRSLADLSKTIDLCVAGASDILVIDSISHCWEQFIEAYRAEKKRTFIQFQDWGILKPKWKREFSDKLVMSPLHIIFTGRAGYEYEQELNEDTNKKELVKSGIKMKVEGETEYEPDIVVLMSKVKTLDHSGSMTLQRQAQVIKDRTTKIDGLTFNNPEFKDFKPAIDVLLSGKASVNDMRETTDSFVSDDEAEKQKLRRQILLEKIEQILTILFPGQSKEEKKLRAVVAEKFFETNSWKEITVMGLKNLEYGLKGLEMFRAKVEKKSNECKAEGVELTADEIVKIADEMKGEKFDLNEAIGG